MNNSNLILISCIVCVAVLSGCGGGGGSVQCNVPGSCTFNTNVVISPPVNTVLPPAPPPVIPRVIDPPLAIVHLPGVLEIGEGDLRWKTNGTMLAVVVRFGFFASSVQLVSCTSGTTCLKSGPWNLEVVLDSNVESNLTDTKDSSIKSYLADHIIQPLNTWYVVNSGRFNGVITVEQVSSSLVPTEWNYLQRLAGRLPQLISITESGAKLR